MRTKLIAFLLMTVASTAALADGTRSGVLAGYDPQTRMLFLDDGRTYSLRNGVSVPPQLAPGQEVTLFTDDDYVWEVKLILIAPSSLR